MTEATTAAPAADTTTAASTAATTTPAATTTETTPATTTASTETTAASAAVDWRAGLEGESKEFATRYASVGDLAKGAVELRKLNSSMVRVPAADAKAEDVAKFRKAIGVPDKPEEYKADLGRDLTDADKPVVDAVAKIMYEAGVPAQAFTKVSKAVTELAQAQQSEQNRVAVKARDEAQAALRKEWGADFDSNLTLAQRALKTFGGEPMEALLNTVVNGAKLGDSPTLIKAFGEIGRRMGEGEFIGAVSSSERSSIQERVDRLLRDNPPGTEKYKALDVQRELTSLYEKMHGSGPRVPLQ